MRLIQVLCLLQFEREEDVFGLGDLFETTTAAKKRKDEGSNDRSDHKKSRRD